MTEQRTTSERTGILDPNEESLLASIQSQGFPGWAYLTIKQGRATLCGMRGLAGGPERVAHIEDLIIPGDPEIPARLYVPDRDRSLPVAVSFHGGGWVCGSYDDIDASVRALANRSRCAVLSVIIGSHQNINIRRPLMTHIQPFNGRASMPVNTDWTGKG